ncbi:uncharacterized protein LOC133190776 [Saccostrea echinata]|uniref:uncharacterized protein LOC133190776 n=1 Tax=Saccostrea echinata TaxID=191078 RepID=UPI002A83C79B|nr:uncharacterized protein LOC133190776 [Saccostrea echinata]
MPVGISDLPDELLVIIFSFMSFYDIVKNVKAVCTHWRDLGDRKCLWNTRGLLKWVKEADDEQGYIQRVRVIARNIDTLKYSEINGEEPDDYLASNIEKLYLKRFCEPTPFKSMLMGMFEEYNGPLLFLREDIFCPNLKAIYTVDTNVSPTCFRKLLEKYPHVTTIVWDWSLYSELCAYLPPIRPLPKLEKLTLVECQNTDDFPRYEDSNIVWNRQNRNVELQDLVSEHPEIESLNVSLRRTSGRTIKTIFETCQNLRGLKLSACNTHETDELDLTSSLPMLEELSLDRFERDPNEMKNLFVAACSSKKLRKLTLLDCTNITEEMYEYIGKNCPLLNTFAAAERGFGDRDLRFCLDHWENTFVNNKALEYLSICRNLQELRICYSDESAVTDEGILALARGCVQLKEVDFEGCLGITDYGIMELSRHCNGLSFVNLCHCRHITGFGLSCLVMNCPRLQEFQMYSCPFVEQIVLCNNERFPEIPIASLHQNMAAGNTECDCYEVFRSGETYSESKCCPRVIQGQNEIKVMYGLTNEIIKQKSQKNGNLGNQKNSQTTIMEDSDLSKVFKPINPLQVPFDHSWIQKLDLSACRRVCDSDILKICKYCPEIRNLNLAYNHKLSDTSIIVLARHLTLLKELDLEGIKNLTNASLACLVEGNLEFLSLYACPKMSIIGFKNFLVSSKNLKKVKIRLNKDDLSVELRRDTIRSMLSEEECGFVMEQGEFSYYVTLESKNSKND